MKLIVVSAIPKLRLELSNLNPEMNIKEVLTYVCQDSTEVCRWDDYVVTILSGDSAIQLSPRELEGIKLAELRQKTGSSTIQIVIAPLLEGG